MSFLSNLFGGGNTITPSQANYTPGGFSTPGLSSAYTPGAGTTLNQSPQLTSQIGGLQQTFQNQAGAYGNLAKTVQPGFSQLRQAGLSQINTQQRATTSNLRDTLAQRRVLGSSFANASLSQNDAEFAQQKANFTAQSYLSELQSSEDLIQKQYGAATQSFASGITQMNFESTTAANLTASNNQINAQIATANAQLSQKAAEFNATQQSNADAGVGKLVGTLAGAAIGSFGGPVGASIGGSIGGSLFGGGSTPADYGGSGVGSGGYNFLDAQA